MYIGLFIPKKSWTTTLNIGTYKDICSKCLVWQVFAIQAHSLFTLLYNQCTLKKKKKRNLHVDPFVLNTTALREPEFFFKKYEMLVAMP